MLRPIDYLRDHLYPRGNWFTHDSPAPMRASDTILGLVAIMLCVIGLACVVEAFLF